MSLGNGKFAFPDKDGALKVGKAELPAGVLIRVPKTEDEVISTLRAAGAKFAEPDK